MRKGIRQERNSLTATFLTHTREGEGNGEDATLKEVVSHLGGENGVVEHDGGDGAVVVSGNGKASSLHLSTARVRAGGLARKRTGSGGCSPGVYRRARC